MQGFECLFVVSWAVGQDDLVKAAAGPSDLFKVSGYVDDFAFLGLHSEFFHVRDYAFAFVGFFWSSGDIQWFDDVC